MQQSRYTAFKYFLVGWTLLVLALWGHVQAYMDPRGGLSLGDLGDMVAHPYKYVVPHAIDPTKDWKGLWQIGHPYYFGVFNSFLLGLVSLLTFGRWTWQRYGGFQSSVGRAIVLMTIGIFTWGCGNAIWFVLNVRGNSAPYPSWADAGYLSILPLSAWALWSLMKALSTPLKGGLAVFVPTLLLASGLTWLLLYQLPGRTYVMPHGTRLETLTSSIYTASDIVLLAMCVTLLVFSRRAAGGTNFPPILAYSFGFLALYLADMGFFPRVNHFGSFYNGDMTDLLYGITMLLITFGTLLFARSEQQQLAKLREFEAAMMAQAAAGDPPATGAGGVG